MAAAIPGETSGTSRGQQRQLLGGTNHRLSQRSGLGRLLGQGRGSEDFKREGPQGRSPDDAGRQFPEASSPYGLMTWPAMPPNGYKIGMIRTITTGPSQTPGTTSRRDQSDARRLLAQAGGESPDERPRLGHDGQPPQRHRIPLREGCVLKTRVGGSAYSALRLGCGTSDSARRPPPADRICSASAVPILRTIRDAGPTIFLENRPDPVTHSER